MKRQGHASVNFLGIELGEELSVDGGAGSEENHIVMNERVQALAGSIYEVGPHALLDLTRKIYLNTLQYVFA